MIRNIVVSNISLTRGDDFVIPGLSAAITAASCVQISGSNGVGKSSLLKALVRLLPLDSGEILWDGVTNRQLADAFRGNWHWHDEKLGLTRSLTPIENIYWQLKLVGKKLNYRLLTELLKEFNLLQVCENAVAELSHGQQKKVSLLKLKLDYRQVWLLDEPFNALDSGSANTLSDWINEHTARGGIVIFANHRLNPPNLLIHQNINLDGLKR